MNTEFYWTAVALTTVLAASRLTRLVTVDKFPPILWLRDWYEEKARGGWALLTMCGYCFSFWATLLVVITGWFAGVYEIEPTYDAGPFVAWWIASGVFAASYLAAVFMANDGDESDA